MAKDDLEQYVPIEVESLLSWAESREEQRPYICKVSSILRDLSPDSFKPQLVSIGPLHKEDTNLQYIERLKRYSYLHDLMKRQTSPPMQPKRKLEECLQRVNASIAEIKSAYSPTKYSDDEFANMMVMDGCFILEFCLKVIFQEQTSFSKIQTFRISIDLMLLENQIPFFVLQDIFDLTKPDSISEDLTTLLRMVLLSYVHLFKIPPGWSFPRDFSFPNVLQDSNHKHVLDCLHKIYEFKSSEKKEAMDMEFAMKGREKYSNGQSRTCLWTWNLSLCCIKRRKKSSLSHFAVERQRSGVKFKPHEEKNMAMDMEFVKHSVVELQRSGVKFKPHEEKNMAMAMKFVRSSSCILWRWRKPNTLVMPTLIIQDYTEVVLRNFIAYEQFFPKANYFFTSYSYFMDALINHREDVGNLVEKRVLINDIGSHKEAAKMINNICKNIHVEEFYYTTEIQALDDYYNSFWPNFFAHLRRTYFNSPWNLIALLAGIILFALTVVQTIFTVMSYNP